MKEMIITLNGNYNYGNRLQNYALVEYLNLNFNSNTKTLWDKNIHVNKFTQFKNKIKYILKSKYRYDIIRKNNIKKFTDKYFDIHYDEPSSTLNINYKNFIVGSDQVWNPLFWSDVEKEYKTYFLRFADEQKRIAYAASFGISELPREYHEMFKEGLKEIPYISVREKAGADIVKQLTGRDVPVLVDPTLLIEAEHWRTLEMQPVWYKGEKYILTYFLGNVPPMLDRLAKDYNYKIFNLMDRKSFDLYVSRVEEFLYLIDHAELVCTDSFHACVFSILFNTPFLVVDRQQKGVANMTSRLDTLLGLFEMRNRYIDFNTDKLEQEKIFNVDFTCVKDIQKREQKRSYAFLKQAMHLI